MDLQKMVDAMNESGRLERARYHVTLGKMISELERLSGEMLVSFDTGATPGTPISYRGFYSDLAFQPSDEPCTVGGLLAMCKEANGYEFTGYKGGEFLMSDDTPLWVAEYGDNSGIAIMDVEDTGDRVVLITKNTHDEDE